MKRALLFAALTLTLSACGGPETLSYNVVFDTTNKERMSDLALAAQRVTERRLSNIGGALIDFGIDYEEATNVTTIDIVVEPEEAADILAQELAAPFTLEVRVGTDEPQEGDIEVEGMGAFRATGIANADIDWVLAGEDDQAPDGLPKATVTIGFTDAGVMKMQTLFDEQAGKPIGIFVRGRLAARIETANERIERTITIRGLPSREIADVFADDMNVGLHMTFEPLN